MKNAETKIEYAFVKADVLHEGKVLFFKGSRISARAVRECYQRYGLKVDVECSCGAPIQTRSYIKKSPRKSVYFCLKPGHQHTTKQCGYIKSQIQTHVDKHGYLLAENKAPSLFKYLPSTSDSSVQSTANVFLSDEDSDDTNQTGNLTYHIRSICQYYLEILAATQDDLKAQKHVLKTCELTTPHHLSISYEALFKVIPPKKLLSEGAHYIHHGRVEKIIHCQDGAIIVIAPADTNRNPLLIFLRNKHLNQFKRWQKIYQTLKQGKLDIYPWIFVYGVIQQSSTYQYIDVMQHGCLTFLQHTVQENKPFWHEESAYSIDGHLGRYFKKGFLSYIEQSAVTLKPKEDKKLNVGKLDVSILSKELEKDTPQKFIHCLTIPESLRTDTADNDHELNDFSKHKSLHELMGCGLSLSDTQDIKLPVEIDGLNKDYMSQQLPLKPQEVDFPFASQSRFGVVSYVKRIFNKLF